MFRPFIATCDQRLDTFRKFVESYEDIKHVLKRPIVYYDGDGEEYLKLIERLEPAQLIPQPEKPPIPVEMLDYSSWGFQHCICHDLPTISHELYPGEPIMFMEDDIYFSSKFPHASYYVYEKMQQYPQVDLVTFYGNGLCYWPDENDTNFMYKFNGREYYGNLCFVMSPKVIDWWYRNIKEVWDHPTWGWDIKIGQKFQEHGFNWYCTNKHYVQHQIGPSVVDKTFKHVQSKRFLP